MDPPRPPQPREAQKWAQERVPNRYNYKAMREFWSSLKFWIKDSFASRGRAVRQSSSIGKTVRDASLGGGWHPDVIDQAVEGSDAYGKSFEKDD